MNFDYSAIIGVYDGIGNVENILTALHNQTIKPKDIMIWVNKNENREFSETYFREKYPNVQIVQHNRNQGVYSRFAGAFLLQSEYIMVFDDDTIPGKLWAENCYTTFQKTGVSILGARGIRVLPDCRHTAFGNENNTTELTEVDFVGHCWVYPRSLAHLLFNETSPNLMNGEDMHLSAASQIHGNIKTYVPPQPNNNMDLHGSLKPSLGLEATRLSMQDLNRHSNIRQGITRHWINNGWKPILWNL